MTSINERMIDNSPADFERQFLMFKKGYYKLLEDYGETNKAEAADFNIFHLLGVASYEVTTHSSMLRELLDANGSHGQGNLFFTSFLTMLMSKGIITKNDAASYSTKTFDDYSCLAEQAVDTGRIDIIIERLHGDFPFCLIIENKVWAVDQEKQIERYWQELKKKNISDSQKKILYLSLDGKLPSAWSLDSQVKADIEAKKVLHCLSYKHDIRKWIENVLTEVQSEKVKFVLLQYIDIIKQLTGGFMTDLDKNIYSLITHPENWQFVSEIYEKVNYAREQLVLEFLSEIKNIIENKMNNSDLRVEIVGWDISISHHAWNELFIKFEGLSDRPYMGVWYDTESNKLPSKLLEEITVNLKTADARMKAEPCWLGWYYTGEKFPNAIFERILPSNRQGFIDKYSSMFLDFTNKAKPIIENAVSKV